MQAYGNLNNRIIEAATVGQPTPVVGMDATITLYSDRHAATVTAVFTVGRHQFVEVREDRVVADKSKPGGMGHQDWICTPDPEGRKHTFRWDAVRGRWDQVMFKHRAPFDGTAGRWVLNRGHGLGLGAKHHYHDWSF